MLEFLYKTPQKNAYIILLLLGIFSTFYNAFLPLHGDEAYYWMWSHHLQTGYYDHPPMIAYLIHLSNYISEAEWGVRLTNVFALSISSLYLFKLTAEIFDEKTALNALLISSSVILVHAGYILTTPDSPLILFWSISLYYSYKAIFYGKRKDYVLTGMMLGLMMLSKYTAILFVFMVLIFIFLKRRDILLNINFYIASVIAVLIVSPMIWWNYQNDWISFTFQLAHGSSESYHISFHSFFDFFAGQFGIFSPVFTTVLFYFLIKNKLYFKNDKLFFLSLSVAVVLLFFFYKSLFGSMELNYSAPAYIGGAILCAYIFEHNKLHKTFKIGLVIALLFTIIGRIAFVSHLEIIQDRMYGNKEAVKLLHTYAKDGDSFYGDHLTIAAYLKYYLPSHPETDLALDSRFSQYDMWRKEDFLQDGLVLTRDQEQKRLENLYSRVRLIDTLSVKKGFNGKKTFYIYRVADAK